MDVRSVLRGIGRPNWFGLTANHGQLITFHIVESHMKSAILTFHATPNFGATLQCYALSEFLKQSGSSVEVINYVQPHNLLQYAKSSFLGKRRSIKNATRIKKFWNFVQEKLTMSGGFLTKPGQLDQLSTRYQIAFTGSDEVWKVDHMRKLDPSFYLDFCDPATTHICSYAASASTVTDLRKYADTVTPLLKRFHGIAARDPYTLAMAVDLTGRSDVVQVVDPTLLIDWSNEPLPPLIEGRYLAVYSWLGKQEMKEVRRFADREQLKLVSIGCINPGSDQEFIGIGPTEWLQLIKHSQAVVTDFFHGVVFSLIFQRPFFAHVDKAKRLKLEHILNISGLSGRLHASASEIGDKTLADLDTDWDRVKSHLQPQQEFSRGWIRQQLQQAAKLGLAEH